MIISEKKQLQIIDNIRDGNKLDRDNYILYYYDRVKKIIKSLNIPYVFQEDLQQECMECIILLIDNYDFASKKSPISGIVFNKIVKRIYDFLINEYSYKVSYNNKVYNNPRTMLFAKNGYLPSYAEGLYELLKNGKLTNNELIDDIITKDSFVEDFLADEMIRAKYYEYLNGLESERLKSIMLGRFPIVEDDYRTFKYLAQKHNVSYQRIMQIENELKKRLQYDFLELFDWPEDSHNYLRVKLKQKK